MRYVLIGYFLLFAVQGYSKEWETLEHYQDQTGLTVLTHTDWLKQDRKRNTLVWQNANRHNLKHNLFNEYQTIPERRDFYLWYYKAVARKGHQVVWPKMAHYISKKLRLTMAFPFKIFTDKPVRDYSVLGSKTVFNEAFKTMGQLLFSEQIMVGEQALEWDKAVLQNEQYQWLVPVYETIDKKTKKTITKIAQGKCLYAFLVPKPIRFKGDLSSTDDRYQYALNDLRAYCQKHYK